MGKSKFFIRSGIFLGIIRITIGNEKLAASNSIVNIPLDKENITTKKLKLITEIAKFNVEDKKKLNFKNGWDA